MQATVAPPTGCRASFTVKVTFWACLWLKVVGLAVRDSPGRIWVWKRPIGKPAVESPSLTTMSRRPESPAPWIEKKLEVWAGGLMVPTAPNAVADVFVRSAWMTFLASLYQASDSRPWIVRASATRAPVVFLEPGTILGVEEPTFHRSMWAHGR